MIKLPILLTVIFMILKLTEVIMWSWWLVFLPIFTGVILVIFVIAISVTVITALEKLKRK